jgi:hypothetical protein
LWGWPGPAPPPRALPHTPRSKSLARRPGARKRRWHGNGGETSNDNATSPRDRGNPEQHAQKCTDHRPQLQVFSQRAAAAIAHPQAGPPLTKCISPLPLVCLASLAPTAVPPRLWG